MTAEETRTLQDKFMLRLPDGMRDRIKAAAEAANRSMNSEIVATLEERYPAPFKPDVLALLATTMPELMSPDRKTRTAAIREFLDMIGEGDYRSPDE